jgi:hypothetical protein
MVRGRATFVVDEETLLTSGELLLVPPDVRHSFRWDQSSQAGMAMSILDTQMGPGHRTGRRLTQMSDSDPLAGLCACCGSVEAISPTGGLGAQSARIHADPRS